MIYSDKQYGVSSVQMTKLQEALAAARDRASDQPWLKQTEIDALKSQIADIEAEIAEYDLLKSGQVLVLEDLRARGAAARACAGADRFPYEPDGPCCEAKHEAAAGAALRGDRLHGCEPRAVN